MMNEIVTFGHPSLKSKSVNITEFDEALKKFDDKNQMLIDHEEVPGFMEKMVMMFNIDSSINLRAVFKSPL